MKVLLNKYMFLILAFVLGAETLSAQEENNQRMDQMWGPEPRTLKSSDTSRGQLFRDGNYAMFVHWGLYSHLGGQYKGKTHYGISEWILNPVFAGIPVEEYKSLAEDFNPVNFDAEKIVKLARDAGMRYIIITAKHVDGFAMYHSETSDFNIVDASPFNRDPMKELAEACKKYGLGFGFYYSQNQDWTTPGGGNNLLENDTVSFDTYFKRKVIPQVKEITTSYGDIVLIWFDTPGHMPRKYAEKLIEIVHKNQPEAFVSGRVGHGIGDYRTLGDMEVPNKNIEGLWESVDVTNDSWGYAVYDKNWKSPREILKRLITTVARGGTYMLNIGPKGDGSIPEDVAFALRQSGEWIKKYPQVIYTAEASPWKHALSWGDVTRIDDILYLSVFDWPESGKLYLPGLKNEINSAMLMNGNDKIPLEYEKNQGWYIFEMPCNAPEQYANVIELEIDGKPDVDTIHALDPFIQTIIPANFADTEGCKHNHKRWMEKFGEWKSVDFINAWEKEGKAIWEVDVYEPGRYLVELTYSGEGRLVWSVKTDEGHKIQNQQNSSHIFQSFPIGWLKFDKPGKHKVSISLVEGDPKASELTEIRFNRIK